ncbi:uncharacterized protein SAPINGB_P003782 [Magnusiomyces paraingens]|uniref:Uncharacterized protein n=1 Tax=Magnusiomyces paraingens TaxID=2606893 RepID=A0A5E8BRY8_9ASCO|nr:uncharacterized protein SAPINGB_P003782 [Saprochaete ingens]VVT53851.1 unnamed protein product [Saprochaete ingens]
MPIVSIQVEDTAIDAIHEVQHHHSTSTAGSYSESFWLSVYLAFPENGETAEAKSFHYTITVSKQNNNNNDNDIQLEAENSVKSKGITPIWDGGDDLLPPISLTWEPSLNISSPTIKLDLSQLVSKGSAPPLTTVYTIAFPLAREIPLVSAGALLNTTDEEEIHLEDEVGTLRPKYTTVFEPVIEKYRAEVLLSDLSQSLYRALRSNAEDNTALALSPHGELYASGDDRGKLLIGSIQPLPSSKTTLRHEPRTIINAQTLRPRRILEPGHLLSVSKVLFFPSGEVVLSAGRDMQIKLWSAVDGSNPRTFRGHASPVTDLALVVLPTEVTEDATAPLTGRNFVSAGGADGTVRLWETGSGELVHTFAIKIPSPPTPASPVTGPSVDSVVDKVLIVPTSALPAFMQPATEQEEKDHLFDYETRGKAVIVVHHHPVLDNAYISAYDLYSRAHITTVGPVTPPGVKLTSAVVTCSGTSDTLWKLVTGTSDGRVGGWDLGSLTRESLGKVALTQVCASATATVTALAVGSEGVAITTPLSSVVVPWASLEETGDKKEFASLENVTFLAGFDAAAPADAQFSARDGSLFVSGKQGLLYRYVI